MAQKPNKKNKKEKEAERQKQNESMRGAFWFFGGGCLAELWLLMVRKFYINGTLEQVVAWDGYLGGLMYVGLAMMILGIGAAAMYRKVRSWKRQAGVFLGVLGLFLAVSSWLVKTYVYTALTPLCFVVPIVMVLGILWCLYDRECGYALVVLGATVLVLWVCRKGVGTAAWNTLAMGVAALYVVLLGLVTLLFRRADRAKGMLGNIRLLPENGKALPVIGACAGSALAVMLGMFSSTAAFYAMWVVGLAIFVLAVYYTVKQL